MMSEDFPYESQFVDVLDAKMHYVDEGQGAPILFIHGNPTSSYLWRNVMPHVEDLGRVIAVDLVGMGKSSKPNIEYRFFDHYQYLVAFIEKLDLKNVTLVVHDWGGPLGMHYAATHQDNVKAIVLMETMVRKVAWQDLMRQRQYQIAFKLFRTKGIGWLLNGYMNVFLKKILPGAIIRKLTAKEMAYYLAPYKKLEDRKPVAQWPKEIPFDGVPHDVHEVIVGYSDRFKTWDVPKLLLYAKPGALINQATIEWCEKNWARLKTENIGKGIHFIQEDQPDAIGQAIHKWLKPLL